jgi:Predicted enzyme with a TIM-barrel fold
MVVPYVSLIHSIDTEKLLNEVNQYSIKVAKKSKCLLEVFVAKEETKHGFSPNEIDDVLQRIKNSKI